MPKSAQGMQDLSRESLARNLNLNFEDFNRLLSSANYAYEVIKKLGPFYGQEGNNEPTFRIPAEAVHIPLSSKKILDELGEDLLHLAKALKSLPDNVKAMLPEELDYRIPPTWRADVILDQEGRMRVNEIEGQDGASALMVAEQIAYKLQTLSESTAAELASTLKKICHHVRPGPCRIAHIRVDNQHNTNADRFIEFIHTVSKESVAIDHINENAVISGEIKPQWDTYAGAIIETSYAPQKFYDLGLKQDRVISVGIHNTFVNKGVFALFFDKQLEGFWREQLGIERFSRLFEILIPSHFIDTPRELKEAREQGKVVKVSWAGERAHLVNRSKGVAIPDDSVEQGIDERWDTLDELLKQGVKMIAQDYIVPRKISSYLRKKGTNLEYIDWYNRICVKYVTRGNPNEDILPTVALTATEVTLGPEVVPAGRKCAFTAGVFK